MDLQTMVNVLGVVIVSAPAVLLAVLGLASLVDRPLPERLTSVLAEISIVVALFAALGILGLMIGYHDYHIVVGFGNWISIPSYHFAVKLQFDTLSIPFVILSLILCGTIAAFATKYLHREPGYNRFFVLFSLFVVGMVVTSLAGTIETLFTGWELVGLSSALLVAFFHERPMPVLNGLRVWAVYRVSDAALLIAALYLHHLRGLGDFDLMLGDADWPGGNAEMTAAQALFVGLLLLVAAAGKSALIPFSGWLPRAMEGPTPSSAVFYGALSVHLGAFLLLRASPILELSTLLCAAVVVLGLATAILAAMAARVQTDIKTALSFASLTQVGIIVAEIGLGLRYIALAHIISHACLRTLQFLRAPTLLQDYRTLENAIGTRLPHFSGRWTRFIPASAQIWFYRLAIERGYLDGCLNRFVAEPFLRLFRWCDSVERRWTDLLAGTGSRESDRLRPSVSEDLT